MNTKSLFLFAILLTSLKGFAIENPSPEAREYAEKKCFIVKPAFCHGDVSEDFSDICEDRQINDDYHDCLWDYMEEYEKAQKQ